ncbi:hypothetical protein PVL30_005502 [Lodderomyces elongisporus]|uniref:uncharacterized protein n=1 Tax=Lodderomyces elongisporus TaxID=36914 RepID=UPI0029207CE2|nr:uncharacterized protein PVL30_005502 [Lodderomyces elongisporus]WLF81702.1 hypothetical protein PVL30_005502 [Lodderomyces elongisporus]
MLKRNVLGCKISSVDLPIDRLLWPAMKIADDPEITASSIKSKLLNSIIVSVGRHGKYFWMRLKQPKMEHTQVLLMHLGMTGRIKLCNVESELVFMENGGDKKLLEEELAKEKDKNVVTSSRVKMAMEVGQKQGVQRGNTEVKIESEGETSSWPPKFTKLEMTLRQDSDHGNEEFWAFVDPRRLGRIRLLEGEEIQTDEGLLKTPPLDLQGPDYSKPPTRCLSDPSSAVFVSGDPDPDHHGRPRPSLEEFSQVVLKSKKTIKSMLLDQARFAGVGNWVADEVLFHAKLHPEEVLPLKIKLDSPVLYTLYKSLIHVCETSVALEGSARRFPENWLMRHRWGKGRKRDGPHQTAEGILLDHITVGGRTSCYAPSVQKLLKPEPGVNKVQEKPQKGTKTNGDGVSITRTNKVKRRLEQQDERKVKDKDKDKDKGGVEVKDKDEIEDKDEIKEEVEVEEEEAEQQQQQRDLETNVIKTNKRIKIEKVEPKTNVVRNGIRKSARLRSRLKPTID